MDVELSLLHKTLNGLKELLDRNNGSLFIQGPEGYVYESSCTFNSPISEELIHNFEEHLSKIFEKQIKLPQDYKEFLLNYNGACLFGDGAGDNSVNLYSIEQLYEMNSGDANSKYHEDFFTIGDCEGGYLYLDTNKFEEISSRDEKYINWFSYYTFQVTDLKSNFETWLERIVITKGNVYWEWNED